MVAKKHIPEIAIFVIAYEAVNTLHQVIDRIPKSVKDQVAEIFLFDDASNDNTFYAAIGYKVYNKVDKLTVHKNKKNLGYGGNQKKGYRYAIDKGYDIVAMLHGDCQYAPEQLPELLEPLMRGKADMVFGSRMKGDPRKGGMPVYKYLGNKFLTFWENIFLGLNLSEYHSGYRIFSCNALHKVPFHLCSNDFHFDTDILIQFKEAGLRIVERPIPTYYGDEISHVNVLKYGYNVLKSVVEYRLHKAGIIYREKYDISKWQTTPTKKMRTQATQKSSI